MANRPSPNWQESHTTYIPLKKSLPSFGGYIYICYRSTTFYGNRLPQALNFVDLMGLIHSGYLKTWAAWIPGAFLGEKTLQKARPKFQSKQRHLRAPGANVEHPVF